MICVRIQDTLRGPCKKSFPCRKIPNAGGAYEVIYGIFVSDYETVYRESSIILHGCEVVRSMEMLAAETWALSGSI
jgi:hypothetical protein